MKVLLVIPLLMAICAPVRAAAPPDAWRARLVQELPLLGHRNWIVIVDSAYPLQTSPGVETVATGASETSVLQSVLELLGESRHVRPIVYMDAELPLISEQEAPGVTAYRKEVAKVLGGRAVHSLPHEQLIHQLDQDGKTFHILVLKTTLTIPYTSVFLRLDCGYCSAGLEEKLRESMKQKVSIPQSTLPQ